ncbi:MAG: hypothetical protein L3K13_04195 [Thermoplasmata archaeon]|nr:hypothetical protein [Thermoplasmata archaeon]
MYASKLARTRVWVLPAALLVALLAAPGFSGVAIAAPAHPASGGNTTQWAYGAQENLSFTVTGNRSTYTVTASFGYDVVFTRTNTSNSTYELESQRTMGFNFTASFCEPSCTAIPSIAATVSAKAYEQETGFANLTKHGTVYENGSAVHALALEDASSQVRAALTESTMLTVTTVNRTLTSSVHFGANLSDVAQVVFTPALGLLPYSPPPTPGTAWNATSAYSATGAASGAWSFSKTGSLGSPTSASGSISGSDNSSGTISVSGNDLGRITLHDGRTLPVIMLTVRGPFSVREGTIWIPSSGDLWSDTQGRLQGFALASIGASTDRLDLDVDAHGDLHLGASATGFRPTPNDAQVGAPTGVAVASQVGPGPTPAGQEVQAQPESVPQAQSASNCLVNGCSPGGAAPGMTHLGLLVAVAAVVGVAALLAALVVSRRRAPKPPMGPVASYPPAAARPAVPAPPPRNGTAHAPANSGEADPLGNLY